MYTPFGVYRRHPASLGGSLHLAGDVAVRILARYLGEVPPLGSRIRVWPKIQKTNRFKPKSLRFPNSTSILCPHRSPPVGPQ